MKQIKATQVNRGDMVEGVGLVTQVLFRADGGGVTLWTGDEDAPRENRTSKFFRNLETVEVISFAEPKPENKMTLREALTAAVEHKNKLDEFVESWAVINKTMKSFAHLKEDFHLLEKIEIQDQAVVVYWRDKFARGHSAMIRRSLFENRMAEISSL